MKKTLKKKKNSNKGIVLIKKANNLIESRYKFDIWETRFFFSILGQIRREDEEFQIYRIWYKDVIKAFSLKSGDSYKYLREAAQSLMGKSFFVNYEENGVKREKQYHILREIDYLTEGQEGKSFENHEYIDVTVEKKMRPFLLQLQKNFTAYDLRNIVRLGVYPVRIYELLKQYERIGTRTLQVEEMKTMFEVSEKYKLYADFFRWVVKPAIQEINDHTDLNITDVEKLKKGRKVVALRFTFKLKKAEELRKARGESAQLDINLFEEQAVPVPQEVTPTPIIEVTKKDELFNQFYGDVVERFGVTPSVFLKILNKNNEAQVQQAINVTNRAKFNKQIKTNIAGFFIKALKEGYTDPKEEAKRAKEEANKIKAKARAKKQKRIDLLDEQAFKINDRIKEVVAAYPDITEKAIDKLKESRVEKIIIEEKELALGRSLVIEDYREDMLLREAVKRKIVEMEKAKFADILEKYEKLIKKIED